MVVGPPYMQYYTFITRVLNKVKSSQRLWKSRQTHMIDSQSSGSSQWNLCYHHHHHHHDTDISLREVRPPRCNYSTFIIIIIIIIFLVLHQRKLGLHLQFSSIIITIIIIWISQERSDLHIAIISLLLSS